jgi:hypothetical protein
MASHYSEAITEAVRQVRKMSKDWNLFDLAGLLDRLAAHRYIEDPAARPGGTVRSRWTSRASSLATR